MAESEKKGRNSRRVYLLIGITVSSIFLILALRNVSWADTYAAIIASDLRYMTAGALCFVFTYFLFGTRWKILLQGISSFSLVHTFSYTLIAYFANFVLPFRMGEIAKTVLIARRYDAAASRLFATVIVERLLDLFAVLVLLGFVSTLMPIPALLKSSILGAGGLILLAIIMLILLARYVNVFYRLYDRFFGFLGQRIGEHIKSIVGNLGAGLSVMNSPGRNVGAFLVTALAWLVAGLGMSLWVRGFDFDVPWFSGLLVLGVINLGASVPSSPGAVGVYHQLAIWSLNIWIEDKSKLLGFAITTHALTLIMVTGLGLLALAREKVLFRNLYSLRKTSPIKPTTGEVSEPG